MILIQQDLLLERSKQDANRTHPFFSCPIFLGRGWEKKYIFDLKGWNKLNLWLSMIERILGCGKKIIKICNQRLNKKWFTTFEHNTNSIIWQIISHEPKMSYKQVPLSSLKPTSTLPHFLFINLKTYVKTIQMCTGTICNYIPFYLKTTLYLWPFWVYFDAYTFT